MKQKIISVSVGIIVIGLAMSFATVQAKNKDTRSMYTKKEAQKQVPVGTDTQKKITIDSIAPHSTASDCWTAVNGNAYNLTSWIANHPGGEGSILSICGKDGSNAFNGQHKGQGKPERVLASFLIGPLSK